MGPKGPVLLGVILLRADWGIGRGLILAHKVLRHNHWKWTSHSAFMPPIFTEQLPCARHWVIALNKADRVPVLGELSSSRDDKHQTAKCTWISQSGLPQRPAGSGLGISGCSDFRSAWERRDRERWLKFCCQEWLAIKGGGGGGVLYGGGENISDRGYSMLKTLNQSLPLYLWSFPSVS